MPTVPDLGRSKHAAAAAHVAIDTLAGTVSATARNTRDTGNSETSTPRLGGGLVAGGPRDSVGLARILGDVAMNVLLK